MKHFKERDINIINKMNRMKLIKGVLLIFFIICFSAFAGVYTKGKILNYATFIENNDSEQFIRNFTENMILEQRFTSPHAFDCVTISCSDHDMNLKGQMIIEVYDESNEKLIAYKRIENNQIHYGVPVEIDFHEKMGADKNYVLKISARGTDENAIGLFGYIPSAGMPAAIINGQTSDYALSIGIHVRTKLFYGLLYCGLAILFCGMIILYWLVYKKEFDVHHMFLVLVIPFGVTMLLFANANMINDGDAHLPRAYHYANILLGQGQDDTGRTIRMRSDDVGIMYQSESLNARNAQNMYYIYENWKWFIKESEHIDGVPYRNAGRTNMIVYLPSVLGISLARILHLGTYPMIYLGKIFSFVFYIVGVYWAIKIVPIGKHLFLFIALLPISVQQATGITYDTFSFVILFLLISVILQMYYKEVDYKVKVALVILAVLLGLCKGGIYTPVLLLLLGIDKCNFNGMKNKIAFIILTVVATSVVTLLSYGSVICTYIQKNDEEGIQITNDSLQFASEENEQLSVEPYGIRYVLTNPIDMTVLVINTFTEKIGLYIQGMLGANVAWAVQTIPIWGYGMLGILIILCKNGIGEFQYQIKMNHRILFFLAFILVVSAHLVLFLIETPRTYSYIWGIQGRYFLPVIMLLFLASRNNSVEQKSKTESWLYLLYYVQYMLFFVAYFGLFMTQTYM